MTMRAPTERSPELTTIGPDLAVVHDGMTVRRYDGLAPDRDVDLDGVPARTLPRPDGELLTTIATVNDIHFGETECGLIEDAPDVGPVLRSEPGEDPYPDVMNRGAVAEMAALDPDLVVVKGDLTSRGTDAEYRAFLDMYQPAFGDRLVHVRGNHDAYHGGTFGAIDSQWFELPGVAVAVIDTSIPGQASGRVTAEQRAWLDDMVASTHLPVLVFGHHHVWSPRSPDRPDDYFGINPDDSEALIALVGRRPGIVGYFAGHTHRNRVRRFTETGERPWVEVACVKDFPGAWAEYRVHEGGFVQLHHRISTPDALAWTERTRQMFNGGYPDYSFGSLADRCFVFGQR